LPSCPNTPLLILAPSSRMNRSIPVPPAIESPTVRPAPTVTRSASAPPSMLPVRSPPITLNMS